METFIFIYDQRYIYSSIFLIKLYVDIQRLLDETTLSKQLIEHTNKYQIIQN